MEFDQEGGCAAFFVGMGALLFGCLMLVMTFGTEPPFEGGYEGRGFLKQALAGILGNAPEWIQRTLSFLIAFLAIGFSLITPVRQLLGWIFEMVVFEIPGRLLEGLSQKSNSNGDRANQGGSTAVNDVEVRRERAIQRARRRAKRSEENSKAKRNG